MNQMINLILISQGAGMLRCIKIWEWAKLDICYRVAEMDPSVLDMTLGLNWNGGKRLWVGLATAILDINLKLRIKAILKDLF